MATDPIAALQRIAEGHNNVADTASACQKIASDALADLPEPVGYVTLGYDGLPIWSLASDDPAKSCYWDNPRVPVYLGNPTGGTG